MRMGGRRFRAWVVGEFVLERGAITAVFVPQLPGSLQETIASLRRGSARQVTRLLC